MTSLEKAIKKESKKFNSKLIENIKNDLYSLTNSMNQILIKAEQKEIKQERAKINQN
jgi:3-methyladenine DNA glycosylase AlkC